jgi:hypothetical protein
VTIGSEKSRAFFVSSAKLTDRGFTMADIISLVYTAVIFAALIGFVTFCRKV